MSSVNAQFLPKLFSLKASEDLMALLSDSQQELRAKANETEDKCWGYFSDADEDSLPKSNKLKKYLLEQVKKEFPGYEFSFLRYAAKAQPPRVKDSLHLDSNSKTGIGGSEYPVYAWRMLINVSADFDRKVAYSIQLPEEAQGSTDAGLFTSASYEPSLVQRAVLKKAEKGNIHGLTFCASEVLHGGEDTDDGHFLAAFGREVKV